MAGSHGLCDVSSSGQELYFGDGDPYDPHRERMRASPYIRISR